MKKNPANLDCIFKAYLRAKSFPTSIYYLTSVKNKGNIHFFLNIILSKRKKMPSTYPWTSANFYKYSSNLLLPCRYNSSLSDFIISSIIFYSFLSNQSHEGGKTFSGIWQSQHNGHLRRFVLAAKQNSHWLYHTICGYVVCT